VDECKPLPTSRSDTEGILAGSSSDTEDILDAGSGEDEGILAGSCFVTEGILPGPRSDPEGTLPATCRSDAEAILPVTCRSSADVFVTGAILTAVGGCPRCPLALAVEGEGVAAAAGFLGVGPGRYRSPRHRPALKSINKGYEMRVRLSMTWRAVYAWQTSLAKS
jgi:hypothetical protein